MSTQFITSIIDCGKSSYHGIPSYLFTCNSKFIIEFFTKAIEHGKQEWKVGILCNYTIILIENNLWHSIYLYIAYCLALNNVTRLIGCNDVKSDYLAALKRVALCGFDGNIAEISKAIGRLGIKFFTLACKLDKVRHTCRIGELDIIYIIHTDRSGIYAISISKMVGCGKSINDICSRCQAARFNGCCDRQGLSKAILCDCTEYLCGISRRILTYLYTFSIIADSRRSVNLKAIILCGYVTRYIGNCCGYYPNGTCGLWAFFCGKRYGQGVSVGILCGNSKQFGSNSVVGSYVGLTCTWNCRCSVDLALNVNIRYVAFTVGCRNTDSYRVSCRYSSAVFAYSYREGFTEAIYCGCVKEFCV